MASRNIEDLHISIQDKARKLLDLAKFDGWEAFITAGYRDCKEQAELYAQGRTKPGKRVTNAKPGQSLHQYRLAFDIAFRKGREVSFRLDRFLKAGKLAKQCGLEWGGLWQNFRDYPHYQYTQGLSLGDIQRGDRPLMSGTYIGTTSYAGGTIPKGAIKIRDPKELNGLSKDKIWRDPNSKDMYKLL